MLLLLPNGLNPMARMMGGARRADIAAIARAHDVLIVENDAGGPLEPEPALPAV